jgi:pimeloyl-ACP methyl ester carboxylesterase
MLIRGNWLGTLKVQGIIELRLAMTVHAKPDGSLTGTLNSLDQEAGDHPLDEVSVKETTVRLVLKRFGLDYEGMLNAGGTEIVGRLKQHGSVLPLVFKKVDRPPVGRRRPQEPKRPFPYKEESVTFENRTAHAKFAGTLTLPVAGGRHPAVLLITGSGQQDRDESLLGHRPFFVIADYLTRRGIAVLRVDDRGVGGSTGDVAHVTTEDFAGDALAAVAYLKSRADIDPQRIGLVGHSEGGLIAPMAALRSRDVAFIVLLAGPGLPGDQILYLQQAAMARQMGVSTPVIVLNRVIEELLLTAIKRGTEPAALDQKSKHPVDDRRAPRPKDDKKPAGNGASAAVGQLAKRLGSPWLRFFISYDPRPALKQVRCPVLALIGEKDFQVPAKENLPEIEKALRAGGNTDFTVRELPGLNHLFQTCRTGNLDEYARIEETFAPSALELMTDWIRKRSAK